MTKKNAIAAVALVLALLGSLTACTQADPAPTENTWVVGSDSDW